jgi:hypothetical protein
MDGQTCANCAKWAALRERIAARNRRRFAVPGAKWARRQISVENPQPLPSNEF